jgi:hypothetical protein
MMALEGGQLTSLLLGGAISLGLSLLGFVARLLSVLVGKVRALEQFLHGYGKVPGLLAQLGPERDKTARDLNNAFARVRALEEAIRTAGLELPAPDLERSP